MKSLKNLKWYWYIPLVGVLFIFKVSDWVFNSVDSTDLEVRLQREHFILFTWMFEQAFSIVIVIAYLKSVFSHF